MQLRIVIRALLSQIRVVVTGCTASRPAPEDSSSPAPVLEVLSSLAEGADRLFVEEALEMDFAFCCPMPFPQQEFEEDFRPPYQQEVNSLLRFRRLLDLAAMKQRLTVIELNGSRREADDAYAAAARYVMNKSDLLLVVWDGQAGGGVGGTSYSVEEARRAQIPVVWIDAAAPHNWAILTGERGTPHTLSSAHRTDGEVRPGETLAGLIVERVARRAAAT